jgi:hypothetical protein
MAARLSLLPTSHAPALISLGFEVSPITPVDRIALEAKAHRDESEREHVPP